MAKKQKRVAPFRIPNPYSSGESLIYLRTFKGAATLDYAKAVFFRIKRGASWVTTWLPFPTAFKGAAPKKAYASFHLAEIERRALLIEKKKAKGSRLREIRKQLKESKAAKQVKVGWKKRVPKPPVRLRYTKHKKKVFSQDFANNRDMSLETLVIRHTPVPFTRKTLATVIKGLMPRYLPPFSKALLRLKPSQRRIILRLLYQEKGSKSIKGYGLPRTHIQNQAELGQALEDLKEGFVTAFLGEGYKKSLRGTKGYFSKGFMSKTLFFVGATFESVMKIDKALGKKALRERKEQWKKRNKKGSRGS